MAFIKNSRYYNSNLIYFIEIKNNCHLINSLILIVAISNEGKENKPLLFRLLLYVDDGVSKSADIGRYFNEFAGVSKCLYIDKSITALRQAQGSDKREHSPKMGLYIKLRQANNPLIISR